MVRFFHTHPNRYRFFAREKNIGGEKHGGVWTEKEDGKDPSERNHHG